MRSIRRLFAQVGRAAALLPVAVGAPLVVPAAITQTSVAAPQPDPVPRRWQLNIKPGPLRLAILDVEGQGEQAYFYFTYYVENNTGEDLLFAPSFQIATDDGEIMNSGANVPSAVTREILERLRNPFLLDQISAVGLLLQGEENAREGVVIWPAENLEVDEVNLFAAGFSGETKTIIRPDTGEPVLLRKTLMLRHETPGDIAGIGDRPLDRVDRRWIMR